MNFTEYYFRYRKLLVEGKTTTAVARATTTAGDKSPDSHDVRGRLRSVLPRHRFDARQDVLHIAAHAFSCKAVRTGRQSSPNRICNSFRNGAHRFAHRTGL